MSQVQLDAGEMKTFLHHMINNNRHIQSKGLVGASTEIVGESGLGKTSISLQVAKEFGIDHVKLNLAQIEELGDLVGFPIKQFELAMKGASAPVTAGPPKMERVKQPDGSFKFQKVAAPATTGTGEKVWVDEPAVQSFIDRGYDFTGQNRMSYCAPEWISDKSAGGILILDDWNRGDLRFIQAIMELVDRGEYISWKLPKDWHIILTANPDNGEYLVQSIDTAQKTRFVSTVLKWNHERWAEWAEASNIDSRCINFVLMHPEIVDATVNPRSLTTFFNSISSIPEFEKQLPLIQMLGEGSIGPEAATLFTVFINNRMDKLISPKDVLLHKSHDHVMDALKEAFGGDAGEIKASIASILTTRIINYAIHYSQDNSITPEILERVTTLVKAKDLFTDDLKYVMVKRILNGNKQKFQKLVNDPLVQDLATK
jgi:hypothetical protein